MCSSDHNFFRYFWEKFEIFRNFCSKSEEKSYKINNSLKKFEDFTIGEYDSEEHFSINKFCVLFCN